MTSETGTREAETQPADVAAGAPNLLFAPCGPGLNGGKTRWIG
jgi:hypothetical protein